MGGEGYSGHGIAIARNSPEIMDGKGGMTDGKIRLGIGDQVCFFADSSRRVFDDLILENIQKIEIERVQITACEDVCFTLTRIK